MIIHFFRSDRVGLVELRSAAGPQTLALIENPNDLMALQKPIVLPVRTHNRPQMRLLV